MWTIRGEVGGNHRRKGIWWSICSQVSLEQWFSPLFCHFSLYDGYCYRGKAVILKMMEVADIPVIVTALTSKLSDKKPKVPPMCLEIIKEGIVAYGIKPFPVKDVNAALGAQLNSSNGAVRDEALAIMVEMHKWIGRAPLEQLIENSLRSAQKTEFDRIVAELPTTRPVPTIWQRKSRPTASASAAEVSAGGAGAGAAGGASSSASAASVDDSVDPREYVQEVDLMKKLKGTEFTTLLAEEKWSEQLRGMQLVVDSIGPTPKIKPGNDVKEIVDHYKAFLRQGHVSLQTISLKILALLADGLRAEFSASARAISQAVISKSKEKKMVPDTIACLTLFLKYCFGFDGMVEDIMEILKNKKSPPHASSGLADFLASVAKGTHSSSSSCCHSHCHCAVHDDVLLCTTRYA